MAGHRYAGGKGTGRTHAPEHAETEKRRRMTTCWDPVRSLVNTRKTVPNTRLGCVNTRVRFEDGPGGRALRARRGSAVGEGPTCATRSCSFRAHSRFGAGRGRSRSVLSRGHPWVRSIILRPFLNLNIFSRGWGECSTQDELNRPSPEEARWALGRRPGRPGSR